MIEESDIRPPMAMLAEITHRCPLACPYCSNPIELKRASAELSTEEWIGIFAQGAEMGVLHLHLSGGEPASRRDLADLTKAAHELDLYTNLITSGVGLNKKRLNQLYECGLDHLQLSLQGSDPASADRVGGYNGGYKQKLAVAGWTTDLGIPLTVNAVCHKQNIDELDRMIDLAVELGAHRLEVATVQFHGWAEKNRKQLMPSAAQARFATQRVEAARRRLEGVLVIDYVPADYHATYPKACMGGWGRVGINIDPSGRVLPCHVAESIPSLTFDTIREKSLRDIWYNSDAFNAFRGTKWMKEPCRSCDRKLIDFGGCRCQAMALAGDPAAVDPVCVKSPLQVMISEKAEEDGLAAAPDEFFYRGR